MSPKEIIEFVLHKEELTYYALAKAMGLGRAQALYDIRDGKVKTISGNFAKKIIEAFPSSGYTLPFLLSGDEKLLESSNCEETEIQDSTNRINERIKEIKSYYFGETRGSSTQFANKMGVKLNVVTNWYSRGDGIGAEVVQKILKFFPDVDANWLLTGEGSMLKSKDQPTTSLPPPETESSLSISEELKKKDETIRMLENHIDFLENVIKTKEGYIVNRDFTIQELTKKMEVQTKEMEVLKEQLSKQITATPKGKLG